MSVCCPLYYPFCCHVLQVSFLFYMHRRFRPGLSSYTLFNFRHLRESSVESKSVRPSVALILAAKELFAKFGTGVRLPKRKVLKQGRVFMKMSTVTNKFSNKRGFS